PFGDDPCEHHLASASIRTSGPMRATDVIATLARSPTEANRPSYRHAYTKAQYRRSRARRFKLAEGRCEACGVTLSAGWQCDHIIPLKDGGTNALDNLRVLCPRCHTRKTKHDRQGRKRT
ncbi:MAG: HNH endonuclease, partial [Thermoleophilia bacterium]|nr:HNH endonuclease [Thermoleophilia bacterium]